MTESGRGKARFEWDSRKDVENQDRHGVSFTVGQQAFLDPRRVIARDLKHGRGEQRFFCMGKVGGRILTVRFTFREGVIRIIGAGYWRKGRRVYEEENQVHG